MRQQSVDMSFYFENGPVSRALKGGTINNEVICCEQSGKKRYSIVSAKPIFDENGSLSYMVFCNGNIIEVMENYKVLQEMQEKLLKAEWEKNDVLEKAIMMKDVLI